MRYLRPLDGLRGLAVLLVLLFHFGYLQIGWAGVQMFFVLSGFLITTILIESRHLPLRAYLGRFYLRRTLRIFPLYFGVLALLAIASLCSSPIEGFRAAAPFLFTYSYNYVHPKLAHSPVFSHFWSLCIEEQFYLFWPLIVHRMRPDRFRHLLIGLLVAVPILRLALAAILERTGVSYHVGGMLYTFTPSHIDAFAAGALLAAAPQAPTPRPVRPARLCAGLILLTLVAGYANHVAHHGFSALGLFVSSLGMVIAQTDHFQHVWSYSLINATTAALILCLLERRLAWFFENRLIVHLGRVSYGVYVFHYPILWLLGLGGMQANRAPWAFALFAGLTILIADGSYRLYESRFLALKDRLAPAPARSGS